MKKTLFVLVVFGLLGVGAGVWVSQTGNGSDEGFSYESVQYGTLKDVVNSNGIVKPAQVALVFCKVPGMVEEIYGKVGQRVEKDKTPLFKVNSEMAQRTLERAQAAQRKAKAWRESAKSALDLMNKIKESSSVGLTKEREVEVKTKYDAAVEGEEEAESALKQAKLALEWTTVTAPISGVIIEKNLYIGQPVGPSAAMAGGGGGSAGGASLGQNGPMSSGSSTSSFFGITEPKVPFMIAADLGDMEVYAPISQGDIGRVKKGLSASFTVDAFPDEKFEGTVTEINLMPVSVMGATLYPAVIKVANHRVGSADPNNLKNSQDQQADWVLRPGMTVNVDITRETHKDVWMLPATALTFPLDEHHITKAAKEKLDTRTKLENPNEWVTVWIMRDKKPWPIFVRIGGKNKDGKPGINDNNHAEVLDWDKEIKANLKPDDPKTFPQIIIAAPEPKQSIFDKGQFKIS